MITGRFESMRPKSVGLSPDAAKLNDRLRRNTPNAKEMRLEKFRTMVNECVERNENCFVASKTLSIIDYLTELKDAETDAKGLRI